MKETKLSTIFVLSLLAASLVPAVVVDTTPVSAITETRVTEADIKSAIESAEAALVRTSDLDVEAERDYIKTPLEQAKNVLESGVEHYSDADLKEARNALQDATYVLYYRAGLSPITGNKITRTPKTANSNVVAVATTPVATPAVAIQVEVVPNSENKTPENTDTITVATPIEVASLDSADSQDVEVPATAAAETKTMFDVKLALMILGGVFVFSVIFGIIAGKNSKKGYRRA